MARSTTFTTYFNAKSDASLDREFSKLVAKGVQSYGAIGRAADVASRQTANLLGGKGSAGTGAANTRALVDRATAIRTVGTTSATAVRGVDSFTNSTKRQSTVTAVATKNNEALARSLQTTARAFSVVQGPLGPIAGRLTAISTAVQELTGFRLGLVGVAAALFSIGRLGNDYATLSSRIRPFFDSQVNANAALDRIVGIAKRSRTALEPVVDLYTRLTASASQLGISQSSIDQVVESASKLATLSGGTSQARSGALVQFSQALGANFRGSGQELQSLREGAPLILQAIEKGFKNVDGTIGITDGKLRELAAKGELTSKSVLEAIARVFPEYQKQFDTLPTTLTSASTEFTNALTVQVGKFDQAVKLTSTLASGLSVVSNNLRGISALAIGTGVAFAAIKLGPQVKDGLATLQQFFVAAQREAELRRGNALLDREFALQEVATTKAAVEGSAARIAALRAEEAELAKLIVELEAAKVAQDRLVTAARNSSTGRALDPNSTLKRPIFVSTGQAEKGATEATKALDNAQTKLRGTGAALSAVQKELVVQTQAQGVATTVAVQKLNTAIPSASKLTTAFGGLKSAGSAVAALFGGTLGISIAVITTALYLLATAETAAEAATRKNEEAQRQFEASVDRATGKVYGQIGALERLANAKVQSDAVVATVGQAKQKGQTLLSSALQFGQPSAGERPGFRTVNGFRVQVPGRPNNSPEAAARREVADAAGAFQRGERGSLNRLQNALLKNADKIDGLRAALPDLGKQVQDFRVSVKGGVNSAGENVKGTVQAAARARIEAGRPRPGDTAKAFGDTSGATDETGEKKLSKSQVAAEAKIRAARTDLETAKANLAKVRADGAQEGESQDAYIDRLAAAQRAVTDLTKAEADARKSRSAGNAQDRRDAAAAAREAKKTQAEINQTKKEDAGAKKTSALTALEDRDLAPQSDEYLQARIAILRTYDDEVNAIDSTKAKSHEAADQILKDAKARQKPFEDIVRANERNLEISRLSLSGREDEANALGRAYDLYDQVGKVTQDQYEYLVRSEASNAKINDLLESRGRITSLIKGTADQARDAFEQFLLDIPEKGANAGLDLLKTLQAQVTRISVRSFVEKIFAGSDEKIRALVSGKSTVDTAIGSFADSITNSDKGLKTFTEALSGAATAIRTAKDEIAAAANPATPAGTPAAAAQSALTGGGSTGTSSSPLTSVISSTVRATLSGTPSAATDEGNVDVTAPRAGRVIPGLLQRALPNGDKVSSTLFSGLFSNLDKLKDKLGGKRDLGNGDVLNGDGTIGTGSKFFSKLGDTFGGALKGAGEGAIASGFAKAIGIKQSQTGASIGGALGSQLGGLFGPLGKTLGPIVGGLLGGTIGALFQKPKFGTASVSLNANGEAVGGIGTGNDKAASSAATGAAKSVAQGINSIATQLGATISNLPGLTVGSFDGKARVATTATTKSLNYNNFNASTLFNFDDDQQAAIEFAVRYSISHAVIEGISQASKNIINSGQDLDQAIQKAIAIEQIPKRLLAITDPVKYAVTELNTEFSKLISYLKEGGATAEQFADAQKLYELERAKAIEQATAQASAAINQFLEDMVGGSSSPLNKRTVYDNAASELAKFKGDIATGKVVDQNDLLAAARNFQDASRNLNGSSSSFFDDFNSLRDLLTKARDNAGGSGNVTNLPVSPFSTATGIPQLTSLSGTSAIAGGTGSSDQAALDIINAQKYSTATLQAALIAKLDQVVGAVDGVGYALGAGGSGGGLSALALLPSYSR